MTSLLFAQTFCWLSQFADEFRSRKNPTCFLQNVKTFRRNFAFQISGWDEDSICMYLQGPQKCCSHVAFFVCSLLCSFFDANNFSKTKKHKILKWTFYQNTCMLLFFIPQETYWVRWVDFLISMKRCAEQFLPQLEWQHLSTAIPQVRGVWVPETLTSLFPALCIAGSSCNRWRV